MKKKKNWEKYPDVFFFFFWFFMKKKMCQSKKRERGTAAEVSGNDIIFGSLYELVTLMGRVTGAESQPKCRHTRVDGLQMMTSFSRTPTTGANPVGRVKPVTGPFLSLTRLLLFSLSFLSVLSVRLCPSPLQPDCLTALERFIIFDFGGKRLSNMCFYWSDIELNLKPLPRPSILGRTMNIFPQHISQDKTADYLKKKKFDSTSSKKFKAARNAVIAAVPLLDIRVWPDNTDQEIDYTLNTVMNFFYFLVSLWRPDYIKVTKVILSTSFSECYFESWDSLSNRTFTAVAQNLWKSLPLSISGFQMLFSQLNLKTYRFHLEFDPNAVRLYI